MLASIILAFCALASVLSCATATYTHDASSANDTASTLTSTTVTSSATSSTYTTTVTSTSTPTMSSTQYTTTGAIPTASRASAAMSTSWSKVSTVESTTRSTSMSTSSSSTKAISADIASATQNLSLAGDYATVIGSNKRRFLEECTAALDGAACIDVHAGSIVVTLHGSPSALAVAMVQLQASGLDLPSFSSLSLEMTETVSTTGIKIANETPSQSDAPANDGFILPVVIVAGSLGGLCLFVACCYGIVVFRRQRRKQGQEVARPLDDDQNLDCIVLSVEESPRQSCRKLKEAPTGEMPCQDLASVKLNVKESPQELPREATKMPSAETRSQDLPSVHLNVRSPELKDVPSGETPSRDLSSIEGSPQESPQELKEMTSGEAHIREMPSGPVGGDLHAPAVSNATEPDQWKLDLPCDTPEVFHEIRRGRTSL